MALVQASDFSDFDWVFSVLYLVKLKGQGSEAVRKILDDLSGVPTKDFANKL